MADTGHPLFSPPHSNPPTGSSVPACLAPKPVREWESLSVSSSRSSYTKLDQPGMQGKTYSPDLRDFTLLAHFSGGDLREEVKCPRPPCVGVSEWSDAPLSPCPAPTSLPDSLPKWFRLELTSLLNVHSRRQTPHSLPYF